jgi:transposase
VDTASPTQYTVRSLVKGAALYQAWTFSRLAIKATLIAEGVKAAVLAAITQPWCNGQVEAQITKLKLVKPQMYGRAKLDLLQARLIGAP